MIQRSLLEFQIFMLLLSTVGTQWEKFGIDSALVSVSPAWSEKIHACENEEFLEPWKERYITVTEDIQPSIQEQLEATMDGTLSL